MTDIPSAAERQPYRRWQFSLRGMFVFTLCIAVGLSVWKTGQSWYPGALAAIACWIVLGLVAQAGDLWRGMPPSGHLSCDQRWGWRFAIAWRLGLCGLIVASLVLQMLIGAHLLVPDDGDDVISIIFFMSRDMWHAVFLISVITAFASGPRFLRPRRRRPWTWAVNLVALAGACFILAALLIDQLCITFLVHVTIAAILGAQPAQCCSVAMDVFSPRRIALFGHITTIGGAVLLLDCALLWAISRRWRSAGWQRLCLGGLLAASLAATVALAIRIAVVEIPTITPIMAANIRMPTTCRLVAAAALVFLAANAIARRCSQSPAVTTSAAPSWRRDEYRYYHERLRLLFVTGGITLLYLVISILKSFMGVAFEWAYLGYLLYVPSECLAFALLLLAVQGIFSGWRRQQQPVAGGVLGLMPGLFLLVWSSVVTIMVCSAPILGAWGFAFWIRQRPF